MLDRVTREDFLRWLETNQDDFLDTVPQRVRSVREWVADYNRVVKQAAASLGRDRGHAGIFSDDGDDGGLHDPEGDDEDEDEGF